MGKAQIIVRNSPYIRNSHLIGAGNKFPQLKDANGNIQYRLSVIKQAEKPKASPSVLDMLNTALRSTTSLSKNPTVNKNVSFPSK